MSHQQIPIHLVNCLFVLLIISLAVQIFFQFDEVLFVYFVFVCLARRAMSEKKVFLKEMSEISLPVDISSSIVLGMTCKSFIDFGFFLVYVIRSSFSFIFYICVSNFPGTIYLIDCFYLIVCVCVCFFCHRLIDCIVKGLFLGSLFGSLTYVYVFMPFPCCFDYYSLVVQPCSIALFDIEQCNISHSMLSYFHT